MCNESVENRDEAGPKYFYTYMATVDRWPQAVCRGGSERSLRLVREGDCVRNLIFISHSFNKYPVRIWFGAEQDKSKSDEGNFYRV